MSKHHERVLLHDEVVVHQTRVQLIAVLVNDVAEADRDIAECDDYVAANVRILRCLEDLEEEPVVLVTELGAHAQEFAEGESGGGAQDLALREIEK